MNLYMTELAVADLAAAIRFYRDSLGMTVQLLDEPNGFALLRSPAGARLALKVGLAAPGGVKLHFEVTNLTAELARLAKDGTVPDGPAKESDEGYRRAITRDPDGHAVILFEWIVTSANPQPPR